ncbi:hypothetical protein KDA_76390 [Dictyobacter alpinus]|uniref:Helicase HerA central domain-containing protein n=1 Tax=Dictyobacter alpinus TaxID=2014873 RepID=A0A402BLA6_9CHLR|nr:DUF87 domain-containing protein [Dictyobacter alpinus]GCE32155.1 hypothetical protein KDA_76390 [Dictyobacter alpinus]
MSTAVPENNGKIPQALTSSSSAVALTELQRFLAVLAQNVPATDELADMWSPQTQEVLEAVEALLRKRRLSMLAAIEQRDQEQGFLLDVAGRMWINYQDLIGEITAIFGMRGSGKSTTVALILEHLLRRNIPLAVIDPHGEYFSLRALPVPLLVVGIAGGAASAPDLIIEPEEVGIVAEFSIRNGVSIILDLAGIKKKYRYDVLSEFFEAVWSILPQVRRPYTVVLEEAHGIIPQGSSSPVEEVVSDLATEYRKFGLGMIIADQRPANVRKTPVTQARVRILHEVEYPLDVDRYKELVPRKAKQMESLLETFGAGTALVKIHKRVDVIQVRERETVHIGTTPTLDGQATTVEIARDDTLVQYVREALASAPPRSKGEKLSSTGARRLQEALERLEKAHQEIEKLIQENTLLREHLARLLEKVQIYAPTLLSGEGILLQLVAGKPSAQALLPAALDIQHAHIAHVEITSVSGSEAQEIEMTPIDETARASLLSELQQAQTLLKERTEELATLQEAFALSQRQVQRLEKQIQEGNEHSTGSAAGQTRAASAKEIPLDHVLSLDERVRWNQLQKQFVIADSLERAIALTILSYERAGNVGQQELTIAHLTLLTKQKNEQKVRDHLPNALIGLKIIAETTRGSSHAKRYSGQLRPYLARYFASQHIERLSDEVLRLIAGEKKIPADRG